MKLIRKSIDVELADGRTVTVDIRELTGDEMDWVDAEKGPTVKEALEKVATLPQDVTIGMLGIRTCRALWTEAIKLTNGSEESEGNSESTPAG